MGSTKLKFSIGDVSSPALDVQVFPPLKIYPRNVTLIVGSTVQFVSKGGPQPDANVEYSASMESIASALASVLCPARRLSPVLHFLIDVEAGGLGKGLRIGRTRIEARAIGFNPVSGDKIVYSQVSSNKTFMERLEGECCGYQGLSLT